MVTFAAKGEDGSLKNSLLGFPLFGSPTCFRFRISINVPLSSKVTFITKKPQQINAGVFGFEATKQSNQRFLKGCRAGLSFRPHHEVMLYAELCRMQYPYAIYNALLLSKVTDQRSKVDLFLNDLLSSRFLHPLTPN